MAIISFTLENGGGIGFSHEQKIYSDGDFAYEETIWEDNLSIINKCSVTNAKYAFRVREYSDCNGLFDCNIYDIINDVIICEYSGYEDDGYGFEDAKKHISRVLDELIEKAAATT